ncbi:hypothetical protein V7166_05970 [Bacillus thuringiensis]
MKKRKDDSIINTIDAFAKSAPLLGILLAILCIPFYLIKKTKRVK